MGDAFATKSVTTGEVGPRLAPFTADWRQAMTSLARLDDMDAAWVLPGHGDAWTAGLPAALAQVRALGEPRSAK